MSFPLRLLLALLALPTGAVCVRLFHQKPPRMGAVTLCFCGGLLLWALRAAGMGSFLLGCIVLWTLTDAALEDVFCREIPDRSAALLLLCAALSLLLKVHAPLASRAAGLALSVPLLLLSRVYKGFGQGDARLCAALSLLFGWKGLLWVLAFSLLSGALCAALGLFQKKLPAGGALPFCPFLSGGAAAVLFLFGF